MPSPTGEGAGRRRRPTSASTLPGYEEEALTHEVGAGRSVRLCSAEDLIIHKALAGPPQDVLDIEGIVAR